MTEIEKRYQRDVFIILMEQSNESVHAKEDLAELGILGDLKRAALDGIIASTMPHSFTEVIDAMRVAGVTANQAATVISLIQIKGERNNGSL